MTPLIYINEQGKAVISSVTVAESFSLSHAKVITDISSIGDNPELGDFFSDNFIKPLFGKHIEITKAGFEYLTDFRIFDSYETNNVHSDLITDYLEQFDELIQSITPASITVQSKPPVEAEQINILTLAEQINILHDHADYHKSQEIVYRAKEGERLNQAKQRLEHGQFIPWLEQNTKVSRQQANNYMRLAREYPELLDDNANVKSTLHSLTMTQANELINAPEQVKETVMLRLENGESVSVSEIKQLKQDYEQLSSEAELIAMANSELHDDVAEKQAEINALEKQLEELIKEGGVNDLVNTKTSALQQQIDWLTEQQNQAIESGVQMQLVKRQREITELETKQRLLSSELETLESKIKQRQTLETLNSQYQQASAQLLEKLLSMDLLIKTMDDSKNKLFEHKTIKMVTEAADHCQAMADKLFTLAQHKQTELEDWMDIPLDDIDKSQDFYYFTEFSAEKGNVITEKFSDSKTKKDGLDKFLKAVKKVNTVIVTAYSSKRNLKPGDSFTIANGDSRYVDGKFISC